jgi:hypothetical protein
VQRHERPSALRAFFAGVLSALTLDFDSPPPSLPPRPPVWVEIGRDWGVVGHDLHGAARRLDGDWYGYQQAIPRGGERVFELAEREQQHRHELELRHLGNVSRSHARGQIFSFLLSLVIVVSGALLIANNKDIAGYATLLVGGGTLLRATFRRRPRD